MKAIIRTISLSLLWVTLALLLASCASQITYERLTSEDCLVLIPTEIISTGGMQLTRDYFLNFSDGQKKRKISKVRNDLIPVLIRSDSVTISSISSSISPGGHNVVGGETSYPLDLALPYVPGKVIVFEYTFAQSYEKPDETHVLSRWGFTATPELKKQDYLADFFARPESSSWNN